MYQLLKTMCGIYAPAGEEDLMTEFVLNYVQTNQKNWAAQPVIHAGQGFQNNIILAFGTPRTAVFAHLDSIGFTARYNNELIKLGGPAYTTA
jgi:putative aminopeptidase FrvX